MRTFVYIIFPYCHHHHHRCLVLTRAKRISSPLVLRSSFSFHSVVDNNKMTTAVERLQNPGPIHPPKVAQSAIKPAIARPIRIRVVDPLDHEAPAIIHEPRSYNAREANGAAAILISGAGGGVSGPSGQFFFISFCFDKTELFDTRVISIRNLPLSSGQTRSPPLRSLHPT
jgi:hypothetical protein